MQYTPVCKESPLAPVRLKKDGSCFVWEVVRCPYCERMHHHGAGQIGGKHALGLLGGRQAHCHPQFHVPREELEHLPLWCGDAEYRLVAIEGKPSKHELDEHFPVVSGEWSALHVSNWRALPGYPLPDWWREQARPKATDRQPFSPEMKDQVWLKTNGHCSYCGIPLLPFTNFTIDHVQPVSRGGTDAFVNLTPCCKTCNARKNALPIETFRERCGGGAFWIEQNGGSL